MSLLQGDFKGSHASFKAQVCFDFTTTNTENVNTNT